MSDHGLELARTKMRAAGVNARAIDVFAHYYRLLESGQTGIIPEDSIEPLASPDLLADVEVDPLAAREALARTAVIKLNGGLGTSMGMDGAKSLLPVRPGLSFLDLIVQQVLAARREHGVTLPLLLMNSFLTHTESLAALAAYPELAVPGIPLDFVQNLEPRLRAEDLTPVSWPADPSLEWCPPGHGDIFTALLASGVLDALLAAGYRYAAVSNSDNLGAAPSAQLAGWFAATGAPYAAEVCRRTAADRKGGHFAVRRSDGRIILRDSAQTAPEDMRHFTDEGRHPYFNTNNIWFDLRAVADALAARGAVLGLPLIRNIKTVDPRDVTTPEVIQLETAMGTAIEVFDDARAIAVGRDRFLPVKTTNDLLLLRSDAYRISPQGVPLLDGECAPLVDLDTRHFRTLTDFEARFPHGAPSLRDAVGLTVRGDWTFGNDVVVLGDVRLEAEEGEPRAVPSGTLLSGSGLH